MAAPAEQKQRRAASSRMLRLIAVLALLAVVACKSAPQSQQAQNGPDTQAEAAVSPEAPTSPPPRLVGSYVISEVEHKGAVNMIPPDFATVIMFMADGTFNRFSRKNGRMDHSDSGIYRLETTASGETLLFMKTIFANSKTVKDAPEKQHTIDLSADGEVLRMGGTDGKVGVFRRTDLTAPKR